MGDLARDFEHPGCYARALGGCSRKMSREHYISKSVLELIEGGPDEISKSVSVRGLSFQKQGAVRALGINSLVGNVLCDLHNSLLSRYDSAGKAMFLAMNRMHDAVVWPDQGDKVLHIDGDALERWILKTLCGGLYSGAFLVGPDQKLKGVCPPTAWLEALFHDAPIPRHLGLYYIPYKAGDSFTTDELVLRFEPLGSVQAIGGVRVWFFGFEFALLLVKIPRGVPSLFDGGERRPAGLMETSSGFRICLHWRAGAASKPIIMRAERHLSGSEGVARGV